MRNRTTDISSQDGPTTSAGRPFHALLAAGGTGGHVYPAIAIADAIKTEHPDAKILFVGTKTHMEWEAVPKAGYNIVSIWISGFHRRFTLKNMLFPIKLATSIAQSFRIISNFGPDAVISCGGYVAGPVGWTAAQRDIPLYIQEQNSFPGVTNRLLAKYAKTIFTAFKDAENYLPEEKTVLTGNPTRSDLTGADREESLNHFNFNKERPVLLILGGSGGAKTINAAISKHIGTLHNELDLQIIWQCGPRYYDELHIEVDTEKYNRLRLKDFIHNMPEAYAAADLVISRAGALSCSELALTGKAGILVPSPNVAGDHQTKNARSMVENGAAELVPDSQLKDQLSDIVRRLISDRQKLKQMQQSALRLAKPHAAKQIAEEILTQTEERTN